MIRSFDTITPLYLSSFYQVDSYGKYWQPPGGGGRMIRLRAGGLRPVAASENFASEKGTEGGKKLRKAKR